MGYKYYSRNARRHALGSETQLEGTHRQETETGETRSKRTLLDDRQEISPIAIK
jgi:hypothetical protein